MYYILVWLTKVDISMSWTKEDIEKTLIKTLQKYTLSMDGDESFELIDIGSINFVKFIIDIETLFDIEVDEEKFLVSELSDIHCITQYVLEKIKFSN